MYKGTDKNHRLLLQYDRNCKLLYNDIDEPHRWVRTFDKLISSASMASFLE